jgi:hypothetical protein
MGSSEDTFQYLVHVNLKSRVFLDRLSQACDEKHVQDTCKRQLSGTTDGLVSCRLYRMGGCAEDTPSTSPVEQPKSATTSHTNFNQISL